MEDREAFLADVRYRLEQEQVAQKRHYDRQHRSVSYQVGDWAFLRLRQRATISLPRSATRKLKPLFVGSYRVTELINDVAVHLELPPGARLHDVFHIGVLKKFVETPPATPPSSRTPPGRASSPGARSSPSARALARRAGFVSYMGRSRRLPLPVYRLSARGRAGRRGGIDVMCGRTYTRRRRARDVHRTEERAIRTAS
jgi:hypothetical protein